MQPGTKKFLLVSWLLAILHLGCEAERTLYRRPALVIQPRSDLNAVPMDGEIIEVSGGVDLNRVNHFGVPVPPINYYPEDGDPGLQIVEAVVNAKIRVAPHEKVIFGAEYINGREARSSPNAIEVPEIAAKAVRGGGPFLAFTHSFTGTTISLGASIGIYALKLPWELWRLKSGNCVIACLLGDYERLVRRVDTKLQYKVTLLPGWSPYHFVDAFGGLSIQNAFTNIGFHNQELNGSTIDNDVGVVFQFGARFKYKYVFVDVATYFPAGYDSKNGIFGPGFALAGGFRLGKTTFQRSSSLEKKSDATPL